MLILMIRINLIFRVSLTLFKDSSLLINIMNPSGRIGWRSIEKSNEQQKIEQLSLSYIIAFSKQK